MAAPGFSAAYQYQAMSTGSAAAGADVSTPMSPVAPPFQQHQGWQHEQYQTTYNQNYDPFSSAPAQDRNSQPYRDPNYARSPYAVHVGPHMPMYYPPPMFSFASYQPRLPPAIRSGPVDTSVDTSRHGADIPRGAPTIYPSYHTGYVTTLPSAGGYALHSTVSQSAAMSENRPDPLDGTQSVQATNGSGIPQSRQTLPLHSRPSPSIQLPQLYQRQQRQSDHSAENRQPSVAERRPSGIATAQSRRLDRSSSPRTSARRSFDRYSGDLSQSSTSSDVEEAAARSPPSNRVRHRPRESRPRFFSQFCDPNLITGRQVQELKTTLPKFLISELPEDASPTCDICAKDYSAKHVQPSEEEEVAVKLPCGHSFGEFCIGQWFDTCKTHKNKVTCPMCRKQLVEPPLSPYTSSYLQMYAARNSRPFQELVANELQAQYAHA